MTRERVAVCGCVWRHFPGATQGWKWKCVKRCAEHDATAGHVVPPELPGSGDINRCPECGEVLRLGHDCLAQSDQRSRREA